MEHVDYIFDLLDWNRGFEEQARGIELAKSIDDIACFCNQPAKNIIKMFGIIVPQKDDATLSKYLIYVGMASRYELAGSAVYI